MTTLYDANVILTEAKYPVGCIATAQALRTEFFTPAANAHSPEMVWRATVENDILFQNRSCNLRPRTQA